MSDDIRLQVSSWGVVSLIHGLLAAVIFVTTGSYAIFPLLAVIFGHIARNEIKAGRRWGNGFAVAGLVLGYLVIAVTFIKAFTA